MNRLMLCLCLLVAGCQPAMAISTEWDITAQARQKHSFDFFRGDTVPLSYIFTDDGQAYDLTAWSQVVWQVVSATNLHHLWVSATGTVTSTNRVSFTLNPQESNLAPTNWYIGLVRAISGDPAESQRVLVAQGIYVHFAMDGSELPMTAPLTYTIADSIASNAAAIQGILADMEDFARIAYVDDSMAELAATVETAASNAHAYAAAQAGGAYSNALDAAQAYTDAQTAGLANTAHVAQAIADFATRDYVDGSVADATAPLASTQALASAIADAKAYADSQASEALSAATDYADAAVAPLASTQQLAQAIADFATRDYVDGSVADATAPLASTQALASAIADAKAYADSQASEALSAATDYADAAVAPLASIQQLAGSINDARQFAYGRANLAESNAIASAEAYTDNVVADKATTAQVAAVDARVDSLYGQCAGGYANPDYFRLALGYTASPADPTSQNLATNDGLNLRYLQSVEARVPSHHLHIEKIRQSIFEDDIEWDFSPDIAFITNEFLVWRSGVSAGDSANITGTLGDFSTTISATATPAIVRTNLTALSPVPGSLMADAWSNTVGRATNFYGGNSGLYINQIPTSTNNINYFFRANNNWLAANKFVDFSCVSFFTDKARNEAAGYYCPITLITPQHGIVADHWKPDLGANVAWLSNDKIPGTNPNIGTHIRKVSAYRIVDTDMAICRLDEPVPTDGPAPIRPAALISKSDVGYFSGERGCAFLAITNYWPTISLNAFETPFLSWAMFGPLENPTSKSWRGPMIDIRGTPMMIGWHSRTNAAGGDSGSPTFTIITQADGPRAALLGCYYSATTAPSIPYHTDEILQAIEDIGNPYGFTPEFLDLSAWQNPDLPPGP